MRLDINGLPITPVAREKPSHFIQTGISAIDGLNTLVRGQKLPIFSGFGLPAMELAARIAAQAPVRGGGAALGGGLAVLGILTDVTNYGEALREIAAAREEIPGRRGYPGYMYTDLASLFERAGRLRGRPGRGAPLPTPRLPHHATAH